MDDRLSSAQQPWWLGKAHRQHNLLKVIIIRVVVALFFVGTIALLLRIDNNHVAHYLPPLQAKQVPPPTPPVTEFCAQDGDNGRVCVRPIPPVVIERKASEFDDKNGVDY